VQGECNPEELTADDTDDTDRIPHDPLAVCLFGAIGIMFEAHDLAALIQQLEPGIGDQPFDRATRRTGFSWECH